MEADRPENRVGSGCPFVKIGSDGLFTCDVFERYITRTEFLTCVSESHKDCPTFLKGMAKKEEIDSLRSDLEGFST